MLVQAHCFTEWAFRRRPLTCLRKFRSNGSFLMQIPFDLQLGSSSSNWRFRVFLFCELLVSGNQCWEKAILTRVFAANSLFFTPRSRPFSLRPPIFISFVFSLVRILWNGKLGWCPNRLARREKHACVLDSAMGAVLDVPIPSSVRGAGSLYRPRGGLATACSGTHPGDLFFRCSVFLLVEQGSVH